jgi:RNA polymerase sigma-70 factor (ECF subfamily)
MDEEKELLDKFNNKDNAAYEVVFKRYYKDLVEKAWYRLKNIEDCEEAAADCFIKLWNSHTTFTVRAELESYLHDTIITVCIDMWRRQEKRSCETSVDPDQFEMFNSADAEIHGKILLKEVRNVIEQFPPRCRQINKMRYLEGLDPKEISEILDLKLSSIYTQIEIGRKLLKKKFPGLTFSITPWIINLLLQNLLWALLFVNTQKIFPPAKVNSNNKLLII